MGLPEREMVGLREVASGLRFPEGPIACPDGSLLLVELARGTLSRITADGGHQVVASLGGSPNGAAIGPDGACYICNSGGFEWYDKGGKLFTGLQPEDYSGGRIERVDLQSGRSEVLYADCDGEPLKGPNDLVFDADGGFWFTDHGKTRTRSHDRTGVFYAKADGSFIEEVIFPLQGPNGIGLSPCGTRLYVAETPTARVLSFELSGPGKIRKGEGETRFMHGRVLATRSDYCAFDSLAVDSQGLVCVGTLFKGGITVIHPESGEMTFYPGPDDWVTNICFGGPGLQTAFISASSTGKLFAFDWPGAGLALNF
ncbi:SMP-30/gluconolactonase/LRE family protein [Rhodovibrionaceae bacterium A322]